MSRMTEAIRRLLRRKVPNPYDLQQAEAAIREQMRRRHQEIAVRLEHLRARAGLPHREP